MAAGIGPTLKGPWNDFTTTGELAVTEFDGAARFTTVGAWSVGKSWFNMMSLPRGIATVPNPLPIATGIYVGAGLSFSIGRLTLRQTGSYGED